MFLRSYTQIKRGDLGLISGVERGPDEGRGGPGAVVENGGRIVNGETVTLSGGDGELAVSVEDDDLIASRYQVGFGEPPLAR